MMNVFIEAMNQKMNFATKQVTNTITLRLPSGAHVEAAIPDADVQRLINEVAGVPYEPPPTTRGVEDRPSRIFDPPSIDEEGVTSFGGAPAHSPSPFIPAKATVRKDEGGNPVLSGEGFRDPSTVLGRDDGTDDRDEDGVGQA